MNILKINDFELYYSDNLLNITVLQRIKSNFIALFLFTKNKKVLKHRRIKAQIMILCNSPNMLIA